MTRIVKKVTMKSMDGPTKLHKSINAYLTRRFILSRNVPSDECLDEASSIIEMVSVSLCSGRVEEVYDEVAEMAKT